MSALTIPTLAPNRPAICNGCGQPVIAGQFCADCNKAMLWAEGQRLLSGVVDFVMGRGILAELPHNERRDLLAEIQKLVSPPTGEDRDVIEATIEDEERWDGLK